VIATDRQVGREPFRVWPDGARCPTSFEHGSEFLTPFRLSCRPPKILPLGGEDRRHQQPTRRAALLRSPTASVDDLLAAVPDEERGECRWLVLRDGTPAPATRRGRSGPFGRSADGTAQPEGCQKLRSCGCRKLRFAPSPIEEPCPRRCATSAWHPAAALSAPSACRSLSRFRACNWLGVRTSVKVRYAASSYSWISPPSRSRRRTRSRSITSPIA
jgi:hypothetical protein